MQPFRIAACQVRAFDIEDAEENLENLLASLDEAGRQGAQLVGLPECAYPAYYLKDANPYDRPGVRPFAEVARLFGEKCREYGYWLAAGMAVPQGPGEVTNSGVVFGPDGEMKGRYDKTFLWHFDNDWFQPGGKFPVWDTGFCRFGVLICADGRQPEVARALAVNGAEVIFDLTAWVSWGRTVAELNTTQCEYLMPVRAFENGAWVAAADKWGPEDGTIIYAGRSSVYDPKGATRVCGPTDRDAVITFDIEPMAVDLVPRRPALYGRLTTPTEELPGARQLSEPIAPLDANHRVAVVPGPEGFEAAEISARFEALRRQNVDVAVFPGMDAHEGWEASIATLETAVRQLGGALAFAASADGCTARSTAVLITPARTVEHVATHGRGLDLGEANAPIVSTPAGNVGLLCGDEGLAPEVARCLVLEGADILAWPLFAGHEMTERIARTRSDENRVYMLPAWPGGGMVIGPNGSPIVGVPAGTGIAMGAQVNRAYARWKDMAPGTNAILSRMPGSYGDLAR